MKNKTNLSISRLLANKKIQDEVNRITENMKEAFTKNKDTSPELSHEKYDRQIKHIATLDARKAHNFSMDLNESIYILGGSDSKFKPKSPYMDSTAPTTRIYDNLYKNNIFQDIQNFTQSVVKKQSGAEHINKTIELNQLTSIAFNKTKGNGTATFDMVKSSADRLKNIISKGSGHIITYDTETLGGTNAYGHNQIDFITEVSATVRKLNGKNYEEIESLTSILGFSDAEYKKYKKYIENIDMNNLSNKDQVWLHRLGIYGHGDTKLDLKTDVFEQRMVAGADGSIVKGTKEEALKGLEVLREVGIKQEAYLKSIGGPNLETYRQNYLENFADLIYNGKGLKSQYNDFVTVGFNNVNFDNQMLNRTTGKNLRPQPGRHLDLYQGILYGNEYLGRSSAHIPGFKVSNEFGVTQQEGIARAYGYFDELAGGAAHTAKKDEETLFNILVSSVKGTDASLSLLEVNQMTGSKAFNRFIEKNNQYGQFIDGTFVMGHGITPYKLSRRFEEFSVNDYLRPNPGIEDADYYGDEIFNEYKKLFGSKKDARKKVAQKYAQLDAQNQSYFDHIYKNLIAVEKMTTDSSGYYDSPNEVFMMNSTGAKSWQNEQGALSFVYDPVSGNYKTFNGYTINKDTGKVGKEDFNQWGPKNNGLYQHSVYEMNIKDKDKWKEIFGHGMSDAEFDEFFQEYSSLDKLYLIKSKEYMDKEKLAKQYGKDSVAGMEKEFYTIVTDPDKIGTMLGTAIGQDNGNGLEAYEEAIKSLTPKVMKTGADGKVVIEDLSGKPVGDIVDMLVERSMDRTIVDSAGRAIRDNNYRRLATLRELQKQNGGNISQLLAEAVANNKKLGIPLTEALINELGYVKPGTNYKTITPETIRNSTVLDKYLEATGQAFDAIEEIMTKEFGQTLKVADGIVNSVEGSSTTWAKKNMAYNYAWNNTMEQLAAEVGESIPEVMGNYKDLLLTNEDLNVIDFKFEDLFPEKAAKRVGKSYANANTEYVTLNLNKNDALLKLFYNNKFENNQRVSAKTNAGFDALFTAFETINNDERFKGINVWGNLTKDNFYEYQNFNVSQLGDYMQQKLKEAVMAQRSLPGNEGFGFGFARRYQDVSNPALQAKVLEAVGIDRFKEVFAENVKKSIHNISYASNAKTNGDFVNEIVDKYFMTFTEDELESQIKSLPKFEQSLARRQYQEARKNSFDVVNDLLQAANGKEIDFFIDGHGKNATFNMIKGNTIEQLNLEKYSLKNGVITYGLNDNDFALRLGYDASNYIRYGKPSSRNFEFINDLKISSSVKLATSNISFNKAAQRAVEENKDVFDAIVSLTNRRAGRLFEETARIDRANFSAFEQSTKFDFNALISILPELDAKGIIKEAEKRSYMLNSGTANADKAKAAMKELIAKIKENDDKKKKRFTGIEDLLAPEKVGYIMHYHGVLTDIVNERLAKLGGEDKVLLDGISSLSKNTSLSRGLGSIGEHYAHPLAKIDNISRPPVNQMGNTHMYDSSTIDRAVNSILKTGDDEAKAVFSKANFNTTDVVTGKIAKKYLGGEGSELTSGLTVRYLQADAHSLKNIFKDEVNKTRNGNVDSKFFKYIDKKYGKEYSSKEKVEMAKKLAERTMTLTTHEQQSVMNSRIYDIAFHKNNTQQINFKKGLIKDHANNLATIEGVKNAAKTMFDITPDGKIVYSLGTKVKRGDFIGEFETGKIQSKMDGVLRLRFFDEYNNVVTEEKLNSYIKEHSLSGADDIMKGLDEAFTLKYEVIGLEQSYGHKAFMSVSEKTTLDGTYLAVGSVDKNLAKRLEEAGHGDIVGKVTSLEYLNEYLIPTLKDEKLVEDIMKERHLLSDTIQTFDALNGVSIISNVDVPKHSSVSFGLESVLNELRVQDKLTDEYLKPIFGEGGYSIEGNQVNLDTMKEVRIKDFNKATENSQIAQELEELFSRRNTIDNVGNTGLIHVAHTIDDSAGSFAGNSDLAALGSQLVDIDREIAELKKQIVATEDAEGKAILGKRVQGLLTARNGIEMEMTYAQTRSKGLKFSNRMNLNLDRLIYGNDTFKLAQEKFAEMGLQDEFNSYFGHAVNADGTIKESFLGKSILDPITSRLRETLLLGEGEISLANLDKMEPRDIARYGYLTKYFEGMEDKISVKKAEQVYSYAQGTKALHYNMSALKGENSLTAIRKTMGDFKEYDLSTANPFIDSDWLQLDVGGQGDTILSANNNIYSENMMIKTGLGGKYEYLALGKMPETHFNDSLIKKSHIAKVGSLQDQIRIANNQTLDEETRNKARDRARVIFEDIVEAQKYDLNSKNGIYGGLIESRMQQSFFGKGSGMQINPGLKDGETYGEKVLDYEALKASNAKFFDTAMFGEKSILKHYSEGKVIDHVALSKQAFDNMGYFKEDFMKNIFDNMDGTLATELQEQFGDNMEAKMEHLLATKGDAFIATRFPEIMEGSDKVVMGYLDSTLAENQIRVYGATGASMKMDFDGDMGAVARIKTRDGNSRLNYMVGAASDAETEAMVHAQDSFIMRRAVNENRFWERQYQEKIGKEANVALGKSSLLDIAEKEMIGGKVMSAYIPSQGTTRSELDALMTKHNALLALENHDQVYNILKETMEGEELETALREYSVAYTGRRQLNAEIAKIFNSQVGEANVTQFKIKTAVTALFDKTQDDYEYKNLLMNNLLYHAEEQSISSKSSIEGLTADRAKVWNSAITDVMKNKNVEQNIETLRSWASENIIKDANMGMFYETSSTFRDYIHTNFNQVSDIKSFMNLLESDEVSKRTINDKVINDVLTAIQGVSQIKGVDKMIDYMSVGNSATGVSTKRALNAAIVEDFATADNVVLEAIEQTGVLDDLLDVTRLKSQARAYRDSSTVNMIDSVITNSESNAGKSTVTHDILEGVGQMFKSVQGSGLAKAAIGIAAGVMVAGYVGGRPRPADTHAMEEAEDYAPMDGPRTLMDPNLGNVQMSNGGYVININARTDKGRDQAIQAIQQAISSGTSSSINVAMNINDNYGNITDRDLERAIEGAFS